jgi:hypothetical protein
LLDLLYLRPGSDSPAYLRQLRLQNLDRLDPSRLDDMARRFGVAKVGRAVAAVQGIAQDDSRGWVSL